jgi:hypothetical protein
MTSLFWKDNLVNDVNYTVTGNNICCNNQWISIGIIPVPFLENSTRIALCGGEIITGVTAQCVNFPITVQVLFKVDYVGKMILEDVS